MNFGLEGYVPYALYLLALTSLILSIFWKPIAGIFYLVPLIPLQTIRYRTNGLPLGESLVGVMLLGVAIGLLRQGRPIFPKSKWTRVIVVYGLFTYGSLCLGAFFLNQSFPLPGNPRFGTWQEYMVMPALLLLTAATAPTKRQIQALIALMCLSTFAADKSFWNSISDRDMSSYSEDLHQEGGSMGYAGTNGLAAFAAQATTFLLALAAYERRSWTKIAYYALALFTLVCLMYSFSRGGYVAFLVGWLFLGVMKQRKLLILLICFAFSWAVLVPQAVRERIEMTYDPQSGMLDNSASTRLSLWNNAMDVFGSNMFLGTGFNTYEYMHLNKRTDGGTGYYQDTHNYYVKVLVETGIVGLFLFLWVLSCFITDSYKLFRHAKDPFYASLGLGLMGWVICAVVANLFGDRWSFLQVNGFMWVLGGLVIHALTAEHALETALSPAAQDETEAAAAKTHPEPLPRALSQWSELPQ
jgi:putative inorganic carbon (hco3(-)) transporter